MSNSCLPGDFIYQVLYLLTFGGREVYGLVVQRDRKGDLEAYARLRHRGLRPRSTRGAAEMESRIEGLDDARAQAILNGVPPDPLRSKTLGIHVQPLPSKSATDSIAAFIWQRDDWLITGEVGMDGDVVALRRLSIEPSTIQTEDGVPRPVAGFPPSLTPTYLHHLRLEAALRDIATTLSEAPGHYFAWASWLKARGLDGGNPLGAHRVAQEAAAVVADSKTRRGRSGKGAAHYRSVATLYLEACHSGKGRAIYEHIAERLPDGPWDRETIRYWVRRATELGYLGEARPGRAGRLPGPKLMEESE